MSLREELKMKEMQNYATNNCRDYAGDDNQNRISDARRQRRENIFTVFFASMLGSTIGTLIVRGLIFWLEGISF